MAKKATAENETKDVATIEKPGALEKPQEMPLGFDGFTEDDILVARISIVQKSSDAADENPSVIGQFINNLTKEIVEIIRVTPMLYKKGMVLFKKPYEKGQKPLCKSNDAMVPAPEIEQPYSERCHEMRKRRLVPVCEKAYWGKDGTPPECNLTYNTVFCIMDTMEPVFISFRSSSIRPIKWLISQLWQKKLHLFSKSWMLSTEKQENKHGTFYVPVFSLPETNEDPDRWVDLYEGLQATDLQRSFDAEENAPDSDEVEQPENDSFNTDELENGKF